MCSFSGNQDDRHFEDGDTFDIYRDNAVDHLTFGYGAHQCMGKNIGRMEMRIFLEELTRRIPDLRLSEQVFSYMPNTSFRGPEELRVEWDPARVPERTTPSIQETAQHFPVGAPRRKDIARRVRVRETHIEADGVLGLILEDARGRPLPNWSAGSHIELVSGKFDRKYSLCGDPEAHTYRVAILRESDGRGGSVHLHQTLRPGTELRMRGPSNLFRLDEDAPSYVLIAGGIGITPIIAMADRLKALGQTYAIHYAGRSADTMAFRDRLLQDHGNRLHLYEGGQGQRMHLADIASVLPEGGQIYACGPSRLLTALEDLPETLPDGTLHVEHFAAGNGGLDPEKESAFDAELTDSGLTLTVAADETLLDALLRTGIDIPCDCREGLCGSCEVTVSQGEIDHRDMVLTRAERTESARMMSCCSRAKDGKRIKLGL